MEANDHGNQPLLRKRRIRYTGKNPRRFEEKYKELNPDQYKDDIVRIIGRGKTPAGMHRPICVEEILKILDPKPGQKVLDATLGYGGHACAILDRILPGGCLWGIDVDPIELRRTEERLRKLRFTNLEFKVKQLNFAGISKLLADADGGFDLIIADLGVSSMQLDDPARGFTFKKEGPLDLRLNPQRGEPCSVLLQSLTVDELAKILYINADLPNTSRIAAVICKDRHKILTTTALAEAVRRAIPAASTDKQREEQTRTIRRVFQALRITVNNEFFVLEQFLQNLPSCLNPGGKAAILTFHSGEDSRVVQSFNEGLVQGIYTDMGRDPIRATPQERYDNPRSKSAILRWVQKRL
ncbi:MAG: 16S rRNA (cytosine(1402)-N(4))-methyltransferase RsmH [Candidatus Omnitrophica bacterium]|nr:16S rRNA (cytosine(1402)-N(4))-methyltransferase RsmH [Candidatus Omnitrophota bacterium]